MSAAKRYRSLAAALAARDCGELWASRVDVDVREGRFRIYDRRGDLRLDVRLDVAIPTLLASRGFRRVVWNGLEVGR